MTRMLGYGLANFVFALVIAAAVILHSSRGVHPLYLLLLFALCSTPLLNMRRFNDRYVLLVVFSLVYFQFYGIVDFLTLLLGTAVVEAAPGLLTPSELVILVGVALAQISYRIACRPRSPASAMHARDWPEGLAISLGLTLFVICTAINWYNRVYVFPQGETIAAKHLLATLSGFEVLAFMLAALAQPLSMLILAYAQQRYRRRYLTPIMIFCVLVQALFGFVVDIKGEVLIGAVLVVLAAFLVAGKIPRAWLLATAVSIALVFPALQANRVLRGESGIDHAAVAQNIWTALTKAWSEKDEVSKGTDRTEMFYERLSLKNSVDIIVARTGSTVPYQMGYTLSPLVGVLIPRLIWPSKPDVPTGQVMNKEFHVTEVTETYISPSHLGELYWNFGWLGVIVGMTLMGLLLGFVGARFDLSQSVTLTRLLVVAVTMRLLVLGAEGAIAPQYSMWIRSLLAIGLLHLLLARRMNPATTGTGVETVQTSTGGVLFPNLLR